MMYSFKDIANALDLTFYIGDSKELLDLMFENDNEFRNFGGRRKGQPQFLQSVEAIYSNVDEDKLYKDYSINTSIIVNNRTYIRNYNQLSRLYPNYEFVFESTYEEESVEISKAFKVLDKLVIPINDPFWDIYLPPNYLGDNCQVKVSDKEVTTIPSNLPLVDKRFQINRRETFHSKELFNQKTSHNITPNSTSLGTIAIDINKLVYEAFEEVYGEKGVEFLNNRRNNSDNQ